MDINRRLRRLSRPGPYRGTAPGFDRGFDVYNAGFRIRRSEEDAITRWSVGERMLLPAPWSGSRGALAKPFFLWVHLYEHMTYEPPEPYATRYGKSPYDGEVAYVDAVAGKLLSALQTRGLYNDALIG